MSEAVKAGLSDPLVLKNRSAAIKAALAQPDVHAKRSAAIAETWKSEELRANHSETIKKTWQDPIVREKHAEGTRNSWGNLEVRVLRSQAIHAVKSSHEAREKVSETMKQVYLDTALRQSASARTKGKVWVNDGACNKRVNPEAIPNGFVRGRLPHEADTPLLHKELP